MNQHEYHNLKDGMDEIRVEYYAYTQKATARQKSSPGNKRFLLLYFRSERKNHQIMYACQRIT